jgi:hypothetical protein
MKPLGVDGPNWISGSDFAAVYPRAQDIRRVVLNMRELSAREAFASRKDDDRDRLAREMCQLAPADLFAFGRINPAPGVDFAACALLGCHPVAPGVGTMLWLATDEWPAIAIPSHRFWRRHFVPHVLSKYRRVEFMGGTDDASRRWCRSVGFTEEGTAYRYGRRGEEFIHFAWLNPNREHEHG